MMPHPPRSTLFPYTTLFRSLLGLEPHEVLDRLRGGVVVTAEQALPCEQRAIQLPARDAIGLRHATRSEEHTSELQSQSNLVCRLLLEKKNTMQETPPSFTRS